MKGGFPLRLLLGLNGVDAGMTIATTQLGFAEEVNPIMKAALAVSPFFFLVVKLVCIDALFYIVSRSWDKTAIKAATYLCMCTYLGLVLYQVWGVTYGLHH